jgi:hypothetical protein
MWVWPYTKKLYSPASGNLLTTVLNSSVTAEECRRSIHHPFKHLCSIYAVFMRTVFMQCSYVSIDMKEQYTAARLFSRPSLESRANPAVGIQGVLLL